MGKDVRIKRNRIRFSESADSAHKGKFRKWYLVVLGGLALAGAAVIGNNYSKLHIPQPKILVKSDEEKIVIESTIRTQALAQYEIEGELEKLIKAAKHDGKVIENPSFIRAERYKWFIPIQDKSYAEETVEFYKKSIKCLEEFLQGTEVKVPSVNFVVAEKNTVFNPRGYEIYLTALCGNDVVCYFDCVVDGKKETVRGVSWSAESSVGWELSATDFGEGFTIDRIELQDSILLKMQTSYKTQVVENAMIELTHRIIGQYAAAHIKKEVDEKKPKTLDEIKIIQEKWLHRDEVFTHGLSIVFLQKFVKDYNIPLPKEDMEVRFAEYEQNEPKYKGTNSMAEKIRKLGVQKAVQMLIHNPEQLFEGF